MLLQAGGAVHSRPDLLGGWAAACPTPPAAAWIRTDSPAPSRATALRQESAVRTRDRHRGGMLERHALGLGRGERRRHPPAEPEGGNRDHLVAGGAEVADTLFDPVDHVRALERTSGGCRGRVWWGSRLGRQSSGRRDAGPTGPNRYTIVTSALVPERPGFAGGERVGVERLQHVAEVLTDRPVTAPMAATSRTCVTVPPPAASRSTSSPAVPAGSSTVQPPVRPVGSGVGAGVGSHRSAYSRAAPAAIQSSRGFFAQQHPASDATSFPAGTKTSRSANHRTSWAWGRSPAGRTTAGGRRSRRPARRGWRTTRRGRPRGAVPGARRAEHRPRAEPVVGQVRDPFGR
jgi:hypothetical protein